MRFFHAEIPALVFLTKVDTYDPDIVGQDLKKTYHSERLQSLMEVNSHMFIDAKISNECVIHRLTGTVLHLP